MKVIHQRNLGKGYYFCFVVEPLGNYGHYATGFKYGVNLTIGSHVYLFHFGRKL
jgi:hypothetical protein